MTMTSSALPQQATLQTRSRTSDTSRSPAPPLPRRRSSLISYASLDDTRQSVQSSAGDFILPGIGSRHNGEHQDKPSHWHSSPLAFAILPAIGGLFFNDGSAFITDVLLLGLAAVFLNWSVRLPWEWYQSARSVQQYPLRRPSITLEDITEEAPDDHTDPTSSAKSARSAASPQTLDQDNSNDEENNADRELAAIKLRRHEILAFISTFVFPALGAYLLHVIRGQLSRPSTGLVSDYNLSIFLLAAEIRPVRQLIRLTTSRTLHLQRIVSGAESDVNSKAKPHIEFESRLEALEAKVGEQEPSPLVVASQKQDLAALQTELKKRYEPRLDALERAVRRYEKRATTLTLLTEQRLQSLENRLQDALSLAAVAAQSSQKPGVLVTALTWISKLITLPLEVFWLAVVWPFNVVEDTARKALGIGLGSAERSRQKGESRTLRAKNKKG